MSEALLRVTKNDISRAMMRIGRLRATSTDLSVIVPLLTALVQLALEIVPGLLKRGELESAIEEAARELPKDWRIDIRTLEGISVTSLWWCGGEWTSYSLLPDGLPEQVRALVKIAKERESHLP